MSCEHYAHPLQVWLQDSLQDLLALGVEGVDGVLLDSACQRGGQGETEEEREYWESHIQ